MSHTVNGWEIFEDHIRPTNFTKIEVKFTKDGIVHGNDDECVVPWDLLHVVRSPITAAWRIKSVMVGYREHVCFSGMGVELGTLGSPVDEILPWDTIDAMEKSKTCQAYLNDIARTHVGDGGSPNIFFVTEGVGANVVALLRGASYEEKAIELARQYPGPAIVEDRQTGVVWENADALRLQEAAEAD